MSIDPAISLAVHGPSVRSPLDSLQKAISIADMAAMTQERIQLVKQRQDEAPVRKAELEARRRKLNEDTVLDQAFNQSAKFNEDTGDIDYDTKKASELLASQNMGHLLPKYQEEIDTRRSAHRKEVLDDAKTFLAKTEQEGQIAQNFLDLEDESARDENYLTLRRSLVQMDPKIAASLPQKYDESVLKNLQSVIEQRKLVQSTAEKLQEAQQRQQIKDAKDAELSPEKRWEKYNPGVKMPEWYRNAVTAKKSGVSAPPASTYQDKKITTMNGPSVPEDGEDLEGNPVPAAWRNPDSLVEQHRDPNGRIYYQVTKSEKKGAKELEHERNEKAYAVFLGKLPGTLTEPEKIKADAWVAAQKPEHITDFMRKVTLAEKNPELYSLVSGHIAANGPGRPITAAQKATVLGQINREISRQFLSGDEAKKYRESRFAELKEAGIDMGGATPPAKPAEMKRTTNLPKPTASNKTATDAVYQAYRQVHGTHDATLKAMKADGWQ